MPPEYIIGHVMLAAAVVLGAGYPIGCLELRGLYHTAMVSSLTVTPAGG